MIAKIKVLEIGWDFFRADDIPGTDSILEFNGKKTGIKRANDQNRVVIKDRDFLSGLKVGDIVTEHVGVMKDLQKEASELKGVVNAWMSYSAGKNEMKIYAGKENLVKVGDILKYEGGYYKVTAFKDGRIITFKPGLLNGTNDGSKLEVYSTVKTRTETKKILLSYNTKTVKDPNQWEDYRFQTPGENGYYYEDWEVKEYADGRTERTKLRTYGRVEPKDSVITVGTKPLFWSKNIVYERNIAITKSTVYSKDKPYSTPNQITPGVRGVVKVTTTINYHRNSQMNSTTKEETITEMVPEVTTVYIGEKLDGGFIKDDEYLAKKEMGEADRAYYNTPQKNETEIDHYYKSDGTKVSLGEYQNAYDYVNVLTAVNVKGVSNFFYVKKYDDYRSLYAGGVSESEAENFVKSFYELRTLVSTTEEKEKVIIKPKTKTVTDSSKYEDYTHTKPGTDGYYYKIYEIRKYSDNSSEKVFIKNSEVIEEAIPTIITKGTKPIHTTDYRYEEKLSDTIAEETQKDPNLYTDEKRVIDGVPDTLRLTYLRHYEKEVFKREEFVKSEVIKPGKPKITKIGTKPIDSADYRYEEKPAEKIEEEVIEDENIYVGKEEVIKGTPDTLKLTYLRHYKKGVFTHEELVDTKVIKKGTPTIIKKGTKKYPYLWRRLKVIRTNGEVEYTGHELVNSHTKDIQKLDSYFKGYQELTDKEFKRTLEKIENQNSIIDNKFSETRKSINELKETSDSAIREISSTVENTLTGYASNINTRFEQLNDKFGFYVRNDKLTTSIKQTANDIFLYSRDGSKITGFKIGADTAELQGDFRVTGNMVVGGTLSGSNVNITNLNADNIIAGTLSGYKGEWNLQTGRFYTGYYSDRTELYNGTLTTYDSGNKRISISPSGIELYHGTGSGERVGHIFSTNWQYTSNHVIEFRHEKNTSLAFTFYNERTDGYNPYITFDKNNTSGHLARDDYPIKINEKVEMDDDFWVKKGNRLWIGDIYYLQSGTLYDGNNAVYLARDDGEYGLALVWNKLYFIKDHTLYEIFKA